MYNTNWVFWHGQLHEGLQGWMDHATCDKRYVLKSTGKVHLISLYKLHMGMKSRLHQHVGPARPRYPSTSQCVNAVLSNTLRRINYKSK